MLNGTVGGRNSASMEFTDMAKGKTKWLESYIALIRYAIAFVGLIVFLFRLLSP
jgi:hypothetical protein